MSETNPNKPEPWVFQNQKWIPSSQAHLALNDAGFIQGATITDTIRPEPTLVSYNFVLPQTNQ